MEVCTVPQEMGNHFLITNILIQWLATNSIVKKNHSNWDCTDQSQNFVRTTLLCIAQALKGGVKPISLLLKLSVKHVLPFVEVLRVEMLTKNKMPLQYSGSEVNLHRDFNFDAAKYDVWK